MKDYLFTAKQQKAEISWFIACFCSAVLMNVFAIIFYQTSWNELYTQILWVALITCGLYALSLAIRVCIYLINRYMLRKQQR